MDARTNDGEFVDAELAALRTVCERIDRLEATAALRPQGPEQADADRRNTLVAAALKELDRPTLRAIEALHRKVAPLLRGFAHAFLKGQSLPQLEPEDLAGDTVRYILQHNWRVLRRWNPQRGALSGYLWGAMRFRLLNLRSQSRWLRLWVELEEYSAADPSPAPGVLDGPRAALKDELCAWLAKHGFEETDVQILCLKLLDSRSSEEVAVLLGKLEPRENAQPDRAARKAKICNTIDQRYHRLKAKLEASLRGEDEDDDAAEET